MAIWAIFYVAIFLVLTGTAPSESNMEGAALYALRRAVKDPGNVLQSWDPTLVNPCTWFHVTCDADNRVTRLDLGNAKLSGHLVPDLGKLEKLQYLELYMNNLEGHIPEELDGLKSLVSLDLFNNNLTGPIPPSLSKLSKLKFLRLNNNRLTGRIPRELTKLENLKILNVSSNNLCGTIPASGSLCKFSEGRCVDSICRNNTLTLSVKKVGGGANYYYKYTINIVSLWVNQCSFADNPRLEGPELIGFVRYDMARECD